MYKIHLNFLFSEIEIKVGLINGSLEGTVPLQVVLFGKEILPWRVFLISVKSFAGIQKSVIKYEEFERCMEIDIRLCMSWSGDYLFWLQENPSFRSF